MAHTPSPPTPPPGSPAPPPGSPQTPARGRVFARGSYLEYRRIAEILRQETAGGALLLIATVAALVWANSPASDGYFDLRDTPLGYAPWHLELSVGAWAADGLLALFFFVAGLELKREFVAGDLRRPVTALVPIVAACGGVAMPAILYTAVNLSAGSDGLRGWAIPTATDIAFALAVLAVISTHLPAALRTFLLTLAVVDDLIAIGIIAFFYSTGLEPGLLALALVPLGLFALLVQRRVRAWYLLVPLAAATWALVHASGIHATVAGVPRIHRPGPAEPAARWPRGRPRTGRDLRARAAPPLGRRRGPGLRVLLRRGCPRGPRRHGLGPRRPGRGRHRPGPRRRQDHRGLRVDLARDQDPARRPRPRPRVD